MNSRLTRTVALLALALPLFVGECFGEPATNVPPRPVVGQTPSDVESGESYRAAAELGDAEAQFRLGAGYYNGKGMPVDMAEAANWFRKSAEQGFIGGQMMLGQCYLNGEGVPVDMAEAAKWFRKAADQEYAPAQCYLGLCYAYGKGVEQDSVQAYKLLRRAAHRGSEEAKAALEELRKNNPGFSAPKAEPISDRYVFGPSGLSIPRQVRSLALVEVEDYKPYGLDVRVTFEDPENGIRMSLYVYTSPPDTKGPVYILDADGNTVLEDREEVVNRCHAVYKLAEPSKSYLEEYAKTLRSIETLGHKLENESRFMVYPSRKDTPIAYAAHLKGVRQIDGEEVVNVWATYLYSVPGFFVKIHFSYPESKWLKFRDLDVDFTQAINWEVIQHSQDPCK